MDLEAFNPWWSDDEWFRKDRHLKLWGEQKFRWKPSWIKRFRLDPSAVHFLFGPRQVGKTTAVKLLVKELLKKGVEPSSVTYVDLEVFPHWEDLQEWLKVFVRHRASKQLLILDEVTSLPGWWRPVKAFIDAGLLENTCIIATGSSSILLTGDAERFFGRRGKGKNIVMLPLSFVDFKLVTKQSFREYMRVGGFPRAVNRDRSFYPELLSHIKREIVSSGKSPKIAFEILLKIAEKAPSAMSYHAIASDIGVNHRTVREYIEFLESLYVVRTVEQAGRARFRKEKKFILTDPGYVRTLEILGGSVDESALFEWIVQEHVARAFGQVFFKQKNGEVDVVFDGKEVEVKLRKEGKNVVNIYNVEEFLEGLLEPTVVV